MNTPNFESLIYAVKQQVAEIHFNRPHRLNAVVDAILRGALTVRIERRFPLAEAEQALALSQAGRMTGKIILIP